MLTGNEFQTLEERKIEKHEIQKIDLCVETSQIRDIARGIYVTSFVDGKQGRLTQRARWARAQGPEPAGAPIPQTAHVLFFVS